MSTSLPEKRIRRRSNRDEITVESIAKKLYELNPATAASKGAEGALDDGTYPMDHAWAHGKRLIAVQQAKAIFAMFQPYQPIHTDRSLPMWERIMRFDDSFSFEDIDRAVQSALEGVWDRHGRRDVTLDSEPTWHEVEGIVLLDLDINEGLYWAGYTG